MTKRTTKKMTKIAMIFMAGLLMLTAAGCGAKGNASSAEETYSFTGIIRELTDVTAFVEPLEGEEIRTSSDMISIGISDLEDIDAAVGDTVNVTYDGDIMESYPAQVNASAWKMVEKGTPEQKDGAGQGADGIGQNPDAAEDGLAGGNAGNALGSDTEEMTVAVCSTDMGEIKLTLPSGWEYEEIPSPQIEEGDAAWFGIAFWAQEEPGMKVTVKYYDDFYGICGTGVTMEDIAFESGLSGTLATEEIDGRIWMNFFYDLGLEGSKVFAEFTDSSVDMALWRTYKDAVVEIIGTLEFSWYDETAGRIFVMPERYVVMEVTGCSKGVLTYRITNNSDEEYTFGEELYLEKQTGEDTWKEISIKDGYAWKAVLHFLKVADVYEGSCVLEMFGELEPGMYRIWKNDSLGAEFELTGEML